MLIGKKEFDLKGKHVVGILNVTPDSFSDGGKWNTEDKIKKHVEQMIVDGAAMIDIGGESTRPGFAKVSAKEEVDRVVPVVKMIKKEFDIAVSVDTTKASVARASLDVGADMINDVWGLKADKDMASVVAEYNVPVCIMHNREEAVYDDFLKDVISDLKESIDIAKRSGIADEKIMIDPGIGFAKSYEQNLYMLNKLEVLHDLGYPIYLGTSRKSVIGLTLDLPVDEREEGTLTTSILGAVKGCSFFRVHDVEKNVRALKMYDAICNMNEV